jgi:hypothetical protein
VSVAAESAAVAVAELEAANGSSTVDVSPAQWAAPPADFDEVPNVSYDAGTLVVRPLSISCQ